MKSLLPLRPGSIALLMVAQFIPAGAAEITWTSPATIAGDGDVLAAGAFGYGYALSNSTQTINGVTFTGSNSFAALGTNVTLGGFTSNTTSAYGSGSGTPWNGLSSAYKAVLQGGSFNSSGAGTITLNNLTSGHVYATQLWVNDNRAGATATRQANVTGGGGNTVLLDYNSTNAAGGVGQYAIGGFTANAATQAFTVTGTTTGATQFNVLQLRDVTGVWRGNASGNWDDSSLNFTGGQSFTTVGGLSTSVYFADTDGFKNAVGSSTVTVQSSGVSTGTVLLQNNSVSYTFQDAGGTTGITGTTALIKSGTGTVNLSSANSYTGGTTVNAGIMNVSGDQSAATGGWSIDANNGAATVNSTVNFNAGSSVSVAAGKGITLGGTSGHFGSRTLNANGSVANDGTLLVRRVGTVNVGGSWIQNGTATIATQGGGVAAMNVNSGASFTYANPAAFQLNTSTSVGTQTNLTISGGTFTTNAAFRNTTATVAASTSSNVILNNGGTIKLSADVASLATTAGATFNFQVGATGAGGIIDTDGHDTTLDRDIGDVSGQAGKLTKTGAGALTLTGALGYTGGTTVNGGALNVNTTLTTSDITVNSGGTLGGNGTLGSVTIGAGGTLAPGTSPGTLTLAELGLDPLAILAFEVNPLDTTLGGSINDLVAVGGLLDLNGTLNVTAASGSFAGVTGGSWTLFTYGSLSGGGPTFGSMPALDEGYSWSASGTGSAYTLSIVPEPRSALLGSFGLLALMRRRR